MSRSLKKGPYIDPRILKKVNQAGNNRSPIKTWSRACTISPEMVGFTFQVHNGKDFISVAIIEDMIGHKLGEFAPTRKFRRHGGKIADAQAQAAKSQSTSTTSAKK